MQATVLGKPLLSVFLRRIVVTFPEGALRPRDFTFWTAVAGHCERVLLSSTETKTAVLYPKFFIVFLFHHFLS